MTFRRFIELLFRRKVDKYPKKWQAVLSLASKIACNKLVYNDTCRVVELNTHAGVIDRGNNRWGGPAPVTREECGGWCEKRGGGVYRLHVYCDPLTMIPRQDRINHEYGHALCFENGVKQEHQEGLLALVGL